MHGALPIQVEIGTAEVVAALQAEAREVGAAMRRIVTAAQDGYAPSNDDVTKADAWLCAVGA